MQRRQERSEVLDGDYQETVAPKQRDHSGF